MEKISEVEDSVAVGLRVEGDVEVVLFVKLAASGGEEAAALKGSDSQDVRARFRRAFHQ